ncbi:trihelix transcription factor DF1 [Capsicum galapagoense]
MLGVSSTSTTPGRAVISAAPPLLPPPSQDAPESGGSSEGGGGDGGVGDVGVGGGGFSEEGERNSAGNRWHRQETLSLLKIRSDMDVVFKDSSLKGPLWEEVSRKMADLGYHRSAKKCKEKFENVYKYHRRTKEGRASKADGKTYRFFDQLQALENNPASHSLPPPPLAAPPITMAMAMPMRSGNASVNPPPVPMPQNNAASSPQSLPFVVSHNNVMTAAVPAVNHPMMPALLLSQPQQQSQPAIQQPMANLNQINQPQGNTTTSFLSNSTSSSSTSSDEDIQRRHMKKRKWKDFFERLMKDVIKKQEELQKKFMETLEKRERDRMVREETWRVQEMARLNREHDLLVQERSMAAAKDATIIAFLQKITEQQNTPILNSNTINTSPTQMQSKLPEKPSVAPPHSQSPQTPQPQPPPAIAVSLPMTIHTPVPTPTPQTMSLPVATKSFETPKTDNGGENFSPESSSRWPKEEIDALISLRTCLDLKYQENGPKGPLWEEISAGMRKLGYNRNAKRCKEKWENINKYFKKVKESNKKRPEDSKTCPYFNQLEALYKEKSKNETVPNTAVFGLKPENSTPIAPIMAQPEQQWPLPQIQPQVQQQGSTNYNNQHHHDNHESDSMDHNEDEDDIEEDEDDEDEGDGYEIVTNKQPSSIAAATVTTTATAV